MGNLTNIAKDALNDLFSRGTGISAKTWYLALLTTNPSDDDMTGAVEVTGGGYARQLMSEGSFPASSGGSAVSSTAAISWPSATADYPADVIGVALCDHATNSLATSAWMWDSITAKTVTSGQTFEFPAGDGTVQSD